MKEMDNLTRDVLAAPAEGVKGEKISQNGRKVGLRCAPGVTGGGSEPDKKKKGVAAHGETDQTENLFRRCL